ncbi:MAG: hypothetical protein K6G12_05055 [Lachnospiraceae bacterium]|nr:hypothetical protein [Lachnospiraceae bacterium]
MKKRYLPLIMALSAALMLSGCGMDSISNIVGGKTGDDPGQSTSEDAGSSDSAGSANGAEKLELLGDLMGENLGNASGIDMSGNEASEAEIEAVEDEVGDLLDSGSSGADAPENQVVVTKAEEWQGLYYGSVYVTGFGDIYEGFESQYDAYAVVIFPENDHPFLEVYSDGFDVWDNLSFTYEDGALMSMYVEVTDTTLTPVSYEDGDAYVADTVMSKEALAAFKATSDGITPAYLAGVYNYVDPEGAEEGLNTGLVMQFILEKTPVDQ